MAELNINGAKRKIKANKGAPKVQSVLPKEPAPDAEGERYSICAVCGEKFEQDYIEKTNSFTHYVRCHKCRVSNRTRPATNLSAVVNYKPFPWQKKAEAQLEKCRFQILACGARTGKDRYSIMMLIKYCAQMLNEQRCTKALDMVPPILIWVIAPVYALANQNFRELKHFFPREWVSKYKEADRTIELIDGSIIEIKSAHDDEFLVGSGVDFCIITEADRMQNLKGVWANVERRLASSGRGRAIDRKGKNYGMGKCIINSSPTGKGFFYELYLRGVPDSDTYDAFYSSLNLPAYANPYIKEELTQIRHTKYGDITQYQMLQRQLSPEKFATDILGQFIDATGPVFSNFKEKCVYDLYSLSNNFSDEQRKKYAENWRTPIPGCRYRIGYDPATGSSSDDPAIVVRDMDSNRIVWAESLYGKIYDQQYDQIAYISRRYNYAACCWLSTGHTPVENQLAKRGVAEIPISESGGKKAEYIESLSRAVQNNDVKVIDDGSEVNQKLIRQMSDYTEKDGKYSNAMEPHDDFVSALYAVYYDYSIESSQNAYFSPTISNF